MFIDFFFLLKARDVSVSITEFLTLIEAMSKGHAHNDLNTFYSLARSILIKHPAQYDLYDQVFAEYFKDAVFEPTAAQRLEDEMLEWLQNPKMFEGLSDEERAKLEAHDLETLRKMFEERLKEQEERHDGGNRWVGTGGTSPFGHGGANPAGIRVGGPGGGRSAVQVAMERRFQNLRSDLILDVRQFSSALRKLRVLTRDGQTEELDLDETISETARNCGDIEIVMRKPRKNQVKLLLLCDVGGSMNPYTRTTSLLFSAAHQARHFKRFESFYFHNCPYGKLYTDMSRWDGIETKKVLNMVDASWRCIIVGDAAMAPYELMDAGGASDLYHMNKNTGLVWLKRISEKIPRTVWLNPDPPRYWNTCYTARVIADVFPMFPFTLGGLDDAIRELKKTAGAAKGSRGFHAR